jgi:lipoate-protein ligase A
MEIGAYEYDDDLIERTTLDREPRLRVYRFDAVAVVLGRGSRPEEEVFVDNCVADGVPILRRRGGGCAVVLDPGNVIVSLVLPTDRLVNINRCFASITTWLIDGLGKAGIHGVRREGVSDLALGDRKIAGSSMQRKKTLVYYSASILVDARIDLMQRYLKHPPREPEYRRHRSHADFVGSLKTMAGIEDIEAFLENLKNTLSLDEFPASDLIP